MTSTIFTLKIRTNMRGRCVDSDLANCTIVVSV